MTEIPACEKCDHAWHGLPCWWAACDCDTSCQSGLLIVPGETEGETDES